MRSFSPPVNWFTDIDDAINSTGTGDIYAIQADIRPGRPFVDPATGSVDPELIPFTWSLPYIVDVRGGGGGGSGTGLGFNDNLERAIALTRIHRGERDFTYTDDDNIDTFTIDIYGQNNSLTADYHYDGNGRLEFIQYSDISGTVLTTLAGEVFDSLFHRFIYPDTTTARRNREFWEFGNSVIGFMVILDFITGEARFIGEDATDLNLNTTTGELEGISPNFTYNDSNGDLIHN